MAIGQKLHILVLGQGARLNVVKVWIFSVDLTRYPFDGADDFICQQVFGGDFSKRGSQESPASVQAIADIHLHRIQEIFAALTPPIPPGWNAVKALCFVGSGRNRVEPLHVGHNFVSAQNAAFSGDEIHQQKKKPAMAVFR